MSNRSILKFLATALIAIAIVAILPVYSAKRELGLRQSSAPTRTPTTEPPGNGNGGGNPPPATSTLEPTSTVTPSPTVELGATPEGGYIPTAESCATSPTVQALGSVNIRLGPGLDYEIIGHLVFLEVRPIVGRAAFSPWWLIQLPDELEGWVADDVVTLQGYTGFVPFADPPSQNGDTPTPGPEWNPTPNPSCTPMPTLTPTATEEATSTPQPTLTPSPTVEASSTDTSTPVPTSTATPSATQTKLPTAGLATDTISTEPVNTPASPPEGESGNSGIIWMLFVGVGLVIVGVASLILRQRGA